MKQHDVIISGLNLDLTGAIKNVVQSKVEKLFEHEDHIIRMRVEVEYDPHNRSHQKEFIAKGQLEIRGNDPVCTVQIVCYAAARACKRLNERLPIWLISLLRYPKRYRLLLKMRHFF